jgi:putative transposase
MKDMYSNRIVGYSLDARMKAALAVSALSNAIATRSPVATIVHSDRGSQFRSRKFVRIGGQRITWIDGHTPAATAA